MQRSAKILALAVSKGYKNFSCTSSQKSFDWPGLNQVSIPGPINTEGSRCMCYCSCQDLDYMPIPGPSGGLWLVEKWSLKAKWFIFSTGKRKRSWWYKNNNLHYQCEKPQRVEVQLSILHLTVFPTCISGPRVKLSLEWRFASALSSNSFECS